jgi:hypothetical protein
MKRIKQLRSLIMLSLFVSILIVINSTHNFTSAQTGTQVGGILWDNITWTKAGSPYLLTSTIQIPENSTLTIEAGTTVSFKDKNNYVDMFVVQGNLIAHGTAEDKIYFKGNIGTLGSGTTFFSRSTEGIFNVSYCSFETGKQLLFQNSNYPSQFIIKNCKIINVHYLSTLETKGTENYIEYNTFIDSAGFGVHDDGRFYFRYNLVKGSDDFLYHYFNVSEIILNYNSFIDNTRLLRIEGSGNDINAQNNYWGTTDTSIIDNLIYDKNDDVTISGVVNYLPILTEPDINTPIAPDPTATPSPPPTATPTANPTHNPISNPTSNPSPSPTIPEYPTMTILVCIVIACSASVLTLKRKLR